jgi:two-component system cell cycle response regulator
MNDKNHIPGDDIHILVVDDEESIRNIIKESLQYGGYSCSCAEDGLEALHIMDQMSVDVVITDIQMPHMDGIELTKSIKERFDSDVIVMTGFVKDFTYEEIIEIGASDFIQKPISMKELLIRIKRVINERAILAERNKALEALRESQKKYQELSITDGLTNLFNSRHFYSQLKREIERSNRYQHPLTLLMLDVDDFKQFNDTFGHLEGDKVLIGLANVIQNSIRRIDSAYRYGGEEFTVILPETDGERGLHVAERIRSEFKKEVFSPAKGTTVHVSVSIGIAQYISEEVLKEFIKRADINMYKAKRLGKDQVLFG